MVMESRHNDDDSQAEGRRPGGGGGGKRRFGRRRPCPMCVNHMKVADYKDVGFLRRFVSDRARMEPRRKAGACAKHQRSISRAIKRARFLALLPYTVEHVRGLTGAAR